MLFKNFDLNDNILKAVEQLGFEKPTEIQEEAIPVLLKGDCDFVGQAQTGTGKTGAFIIPMLQAIDPNINSVQVLILTPTRELAHQVFSEYEKFARYVDAKATTVYGGVSYEKQFKALKQRNLNVVVGTPGRVIDLINRKKLILSKCTQLIIDEADEMLNMGFLEDVQTIIEELPENKKMWMFSATMPRPIKNMIDRKFSNPTFVSIKKKTLSNANITQYYCALQRKDFARGLRLIAESYKDCFGIVFCETRDETKRLVEHLDTHGISALALNGDLSQSQRDHAMKRFKDKKVQLLVCTDVAARGIDVSHVSHVFNMGLPRQQESYVHRIGRTGRAGLLGQAISFITPSEARGLRRIEELTGQKIISYKLPKPVELKKIKVKFELERMETLKQAILDRGDDFSIDESFFEFEEYLKDLSKDQILKVLFSFQFSRQLRQIDESLHLTPLKLEFNRGGSSRTSGGGRRSGGGGSRSSRGSYGGGNRDRTRQSSERRERSGGGSRTRRTQSSPSTKR